MNAHVAALGLINGRTGEALFKIAFLVLLLPVMLAISTPFILGLALLEPSRYCENVRERYTTVLAAWFYIASHAG